MTNEDIKKEKENVINDDDIDTSEENQDMTEETEVNEVSDDEKYQDLMDKFMRLQADFSNYKRRTETQKTEYVELGVKKVANDLLPVIDNFERALDSIENKDSTYDGILMIKNQLAGVLEKEGIVEMKALGEEFDPIFHHAVLTEDSDEYDSGYVIEVLQKGYLINEKTLRPAMVKVSQ